MKIDMEEVPVRVAARVRPLVGQEKTHNVPKCITFVPDKPQIILGKDKAFTFDYLFPPSASQEEVYKTCVTPLVQGCFDGYNATVFAYGQTGSGKTYTIGSANTSELLDEEYGIIPRAMEEIFQNIQVRQDRVHFIVSASYIEIYMEEVRDLLDLESSTKDIHIREDEHGNTVITGATEQMIESADEALSCLDVGSSGRHVGRTNMNEHSSRSHAIFTIYIEQRLLQPEEKDENKNHDDGDHATTESLQFMSAKFHFVDLAGSERAHRTGNVGERFKESVHINSGLLALGNVISALSDAKKKATHHIPYRDSKITRILKDSLGGNAKTVMLTCLSPAAADLAENHNSLKYATRARHIKNKPIVNRDPQAAKLAEMEDEIQALREELQRHREKTLESVSDFEDGSRIKEITEELERCQHDLEIVRGLLTEAITILNEVYRANGMSRALSQQYDLLKKKIEKLRKGLKVARPHSALQHQNEIMDELRNELEKCKNDLATDEEIFAERAKESDSLRQHIAELEKENVDLDDQLKESLEKLKKYDDQLLRQQIQLNKQLSPRENDYSREDATKSTTDRLSTTEVLPEDDVTTKTSSPRPSKNPMERMMQNFRARSDLLVSQYEEEDEVQHSLSDTSDSDKEEKNGKEKQENSSKALGKTWSAKDKKPMSGKIVKKTRAGGTNSNSTKPTQSNVKKRSELVKVEKFKRRGTEEEINTLRMSTQVNQENVHESEKRLHDAQHQLRDLTINIKLKEELIKELVRSDKEAKVMKKTFTEKVKLMEKEVDKKKKDLETTQKTLAHYEVKSHQEQSEKHKVEQEYKKKLQAVEEQLSELRKKQKDNEKVNVLHEEREKKLKELEHHLDKMKQQQDTFQRKLKEETEMKSKLEREIHKDQQRIKELHDKNIQNEKILKRKTEEVVAAQRKLRRKTSKDESEEASKLEERRQWLDTELENILSRKQAMDTLEEELAKREAILKERERMMKDKSELEMKKLRSSQVLSKDMLRMSTQLDSVEEQLREKDSALKESEDQKTREKLLGEIRSLESERLELMNHRSALDEKLREGSLLSIEEERSLFEFDEGIEALEAAIEFKTDSINSQKRGLVTKELQNDLVTKLNSLGREDAVYLLSKYFEKVVTHRENERKQQIQHEDLTLQVDEQERIIRELERGYQQADMKAERRITDQAKQYEQRIQFLMKQVNDLEQQQTVGGQDGRLQQLEKDLYYYKKVSRDLKKKLRECMGKDGGVIESQAASIQSEIPSEADLRIPAEMKSHEGKDSIVETDEGVHKNLSEKVGGTSTQPNTPVRVSRKSLRELSEKELSVRRSQPTSRTPKESEDSRKVFVDRTSLLKLSEKNAKKERESLQAVSLQDSIEQSGNPWA